MRYKLTIEYDGTNYCGFQKQNDISQKSVEETLEKAIFKLSQEPVKIVASGRTDAGVHALGQVIHFDLEKKFSTHTMVMGLNHHLLAEDVCVLKCEILDEKFHARLSTKKRHYRYVIINRPASLVLEKKRAHHVKRKLNLKLMKEAAKFLIGAHDFSSFRDAECQGHTPIKTIDEIKISKSGERILIQVSAKSFLHHMVRNIVGTLVWAGVKKVSPQQVKEILEARDRTKSGPNAPACGLYFLKCDY